MREIKIKLLSDALEFTGKTKFKIINKRLNEVKNKLSKKGLSEPRLDSLIKKTRANLFEALHFRFGVAELDQRNDIYAALMMLAPANQNMTLDIPRIESTRPHFIASNGLVYELSDVPDLIASLEVKAGSEVNKYIGEVSIRCGHNQQMVVEDLVRLRAFIMIHPYRNMQDDQHKKLNQLINACAQSNRAINMVELTEPYEKQAVTLFIINYIKALIVSGAIEADTVPANIDYILKKSVFDDDDIVKIKSFLFDVIRRNNNGRFFDTMQINQDLGFELPKVVQLLHQLSEYDSIQPAIISLLHFSEQLNSSCIALLDTVLTSNFITIDDSILTLRKELLEILDTTSNFELYNAVYIVLTVLAKSFPENLAQPNHLQNAVTRCLPLSSGYLFPVSLLSQWSQHLSMHDLYFTLRSGPLDVREDLIHTISDAAIFTERRDDEQGGKYSLLEQSFRNNDWDLFYYILDRVLELTSVNSNNDQQIFELAAKALFQSTNSNEKKWTFFIRVYDRLTPEDRPNCLDWFIRQPLEPLDAQQLIILSEHIISNLSVNTKEQNQKILKSCIHIVPTWEKNKAQIKKILSEISEIDRELASTLIIMNCADVLDYEKLSIDFLSLVDFILNLPPTTPEIFAAWTSGLSLVRKCQIVCRIDDLSKDKWMALGEKLLELALNVYATVATYNSRECSSRVQIFEGKNKFITLDRLSIKIDHIMKFAHVTSKELREKAGHIVAAHKHQNASHHCSSVAANSTSLFYPRSVDGTTPELITNFAYNC